jgi:hypothetical protein
VGGKPRYTNQIYLGSANKIKELYALKP